MTSVLIVHASQHGGTAGIAQAIGETLGARGIETIVAPAADMPDPDRFDGVVVGAGVYMGRWVKDGVRYLERYADVLGRKPVWLFSSGPLVGSSKETGAQSSDELEQALGPETGPGSGGRREVEDLANAIRPKQHRVFYGAFDPSSPPKTFSERVVRMMPAAKKVLPPGDFRDWAAIEAWAGQIADALAEPVPVG